MSDEKDRPIDQTVDQVTQASVETSRIQGGIGETVDSPSARGVATSRSLPGVGENLGRYKIIKLLGQGGMGAVFLAHDPTLDRNVAVKIPFLNANNAAEVLQRFQREARAVAALHHPNICPVYEVTEDRGIHFMVMAFIEGRPLSDYLKKAKRFKVASAINLVRKLALTLDEAHRKGVIHRDLKPANIMIDARNEPQIMDFGLARLDNIEASQLTAMGQILGTPAYMPPEQVGGDIDATGPSSDIYSLGVMLYEMLTGQLPLTGDMLSLMFKIANETPTPASTHREGIPEWLDKVCAIAMAKKPNERFASMKAFADALQGEAATREIETTLPIGAVAASAVPAASLPHLTIDTSISRASQLASRSDRDRNKKRNFLIAAAALPLFLLAGGWIIKITNPDGTEQTIRAAAGAKIEITEDNDKKARVSPRPRTSLGLNKWPDDAPQLAAAPFDAGQAAQHQAAWAKYLGVPVVYTNSIGIRFRLIPPGQFMMGASDAEYKKVTSEETDNNFIRGFRSESPQHNVVLTQPFYLAVNEVTRASYADVMELEEDPTADEQQLPVGGVDFNKAIEFCERLSKRELLVAPAREKTQLVNLEGNTDGYRLPTEAEWEYACRAGTETMFYAGDIPESCKDVGWIDTNSEAQSHPIAKLKANAFGIYDMHGSVWEWVEDHWNPITYQSYRTTAAIDPLPANDAGFGRLVRGGNYQYSYRAARAAARRDMTENRSYDELGFRIILPVDAVKMRTLYVQNPAKAAATRILTTGGYVSITPLDGDEIEIKDVALLPSRDFEINQVWLAADREDSDCMRLLRGMTSIRRLETMWKDSYLSVAAFDDLNTLTGLRDLFLQGCDYMDDQRIRRLTNLKGLEKVAFWYHDLSDAALSELNNFPNVHRISLGPRGKFDGSGFNGLKPMPKVTELILTGSSFGDSQIENLHCFPNLEKLELVGTQVTDVGLAKFSKFKRLSFIWIDDCNVSPEAVDRLQDALPNCRIGTNIQPTGGWPSGLWFDGDDYVQTELKYDGSTPLTIEALVIALDQAHTIISNTQLDGGVVMHFGSEFFGLHRNSGDRRAESKRPMHVRRSLRLAGVFNKKELLFFVDGKLQSRVSSDEYLASEYPFMIGADPGPRNSAQWFFKGVIQSVRISNTARYNDDYDALQPYRADDATLLMLDFTRPDSEVAKDMSKYNVPCKVIGATRPPKN